MSSPTQRTLAALRSEGWTAGVVERWNPHTGIRQDLFGFIDIVAVAPQCRPLFIQACRTADMQTRARKITEHENADQVLRADADFEVWGWRKYAKPIGRRLWRPTALHWDRDAFAMGRPPG